MTLKLFNHSKVGRHTTREILFDSGIVPTVSATISILRWTEEKDRGTRSDYKLTTIEQPLDTMVKATVNLLMARVDNPQLLPEKRTFCGVLLTRGSVGRRNISD